MHLVLQVQTSFLVLQWSTPSVESPTPNAADAISGHAMSWEISKVEFQ